MVDQGLKALVVRFLPPGASRPVLPGILSLTHAQNTGVAFGLLSGLPLVIPILVALTVVFLLLYNGGRRARDSLTRGALALLVGGAVGNLIDRLRLGYVTDYIDLHVWPIFNVADVAVVCGGALLLIGLFRQKRGEG